MQRSAEKSFHNRKTGILFLFLCLLLVFSGCGSEKKGGGIKLTTGLGSNELFKLDEEVCTCGQAMVFVLSQKTQYEISYGSDIWEVPLEDQTFALYMQNHLIDFLAKMKCMSLMAQSYGITLTTEEENAICSAADAFLGGLSQETIECCGIKAEDVQTIYRDYYLANAIMEQLTQDVKAEVSEDEARVITIRQITLSTEGLDMTDKAAKRAKAGEVLAMAKSGYDFGNLAHTYNESDTYEVTIARGDTEEVFEKAAFDLSTGEVSEIVETSNGYHIIYCVNHFEEAESTRHKAELIRQIKESEFNRSYKEFVSTILAQYNEKAWSAIDYTADYGSYTSNFYDIYEKYLCN